MCDCYDAKCKLCDYRIPIHLGDWETPRDEVEIFCHRHIPEDNARVFQMSKKSSRSPGDLKRGEKVAIRALTSRAKKNKNINHPNVGQDYTIRDV